MFLVLEKKHKHRVGFEVEYTPTSYTDGHGRLGIVKAIEYTMTLRIISVQNKHRFASTSMSTNNVYSGDGNTAQLQIFFTAKITV